MAFACVRYQMVGAVRMHCPPEFRLEGRPATLATCGKRGLDDDDDDDGQLRPPRRT